MYFIASPEVFYKTTNMNKVSLVLRIVAIVGAVACVALWFQIKGQVKQATSDMAGISGVTLIEKSAQVPGILKEKEKLASDLNVSDAKVQNLTTKSKQLTEDLDAERASNIRVNNEKAKLTQEIRKVKIDLQDANESIKNSEVMVERLKKEIVDIKKTVQDTSESDALKQKVTVLSNELEAVKKDYAVAAEKARILDLSEIVEVVDIDTEAGKKTIRKIVKPPYVKVGQDATVTKTNEAFDLLMINRGKKDGLSLGQKIDLKGAEGKFIGRVTVAEISDEFSVVSVNPKMGIPETIESGDIYELVPTVDLEKKQEEKPAAAAQATAEAAPAAAPAAEAAAE